MVTIELTQTEVVALRAITEHYRAQLSDLPQTPDVKTLAAVAAIVEVRLGAHAVEPEPEPEPVRARHVWRC